ncbi:PD-(D/E)XK motif protein [Bacteroides oleiciplenus]|uniref:PD-(D/E)XK motif protein n=2 Tax=Bacteroides oleiciplenus TaxID=626931 RepID=A0A3E5BL49_9BACE|nr:PD-(D/E)XK motif protein [Bacteroides oleiciplenus]
MKMKKINYPEIWKDINEESRNNPDSLIARKIPSVSHNSVFIATEFGRKIRCLYIDLSNSGIYINQSKLPLFRGLDIQEVIISIGECYNHRFLRISQLIPDTDDIFELFISDICNDIINIESFRALEPALSRSLNEWKVFFEKYSTEILPLSSQQGLFGELSFLENFLLKKYSGYEALLFWTGAKRTNHDFQLNKIAFEIKTSAGKQHKRIFINSEKQLDKTGLEKLFLVLYNLNIHENCQEQSLPIKIESIRNMISEDPAALGLFEAQLSRCGYNKETVSLYNTGFSISGIKIYRVECGFPCITGDMLPEGIGDIKYSVMISACQKFEINESELNKNI